MRRAELATATLAPLRSSRRRVALALALGLLTASATVTLAACSAWLLVRAAERPPVFTLTFVMGLVQLAALTKAASRYLERLATHDGAMAVLVGVRREVFAAVARLVPGTRGLGEDARLVTVATQDVDLLEHLYVGVLPPLVVATVAGAASAVLAGLLDPVSALLLAVSLVLLIVLPVLGAVLVSSPTEQLEAVRARRLVLVDRLAESALELSTGAGLQATVDALDAEERSCVRLEARIAAYRGAIAGSTSLVAGATVAWLALRSAHLVGSGVMDPASVAVLPLMAVAVLELAAGLVPALVAAPRDLAAAERIVNLRSARGTWPEPERAGVDVARARRVHLEDVSLGYDQAILEQVNLELRPNSRVSLAGPSGSGKSTLAKLLGRFVPPLAGQAVLSDDEGAAGELGELHGSQVRDRVLVLGPEPHLFDASLAANLRLARPGAPDSELEQAARAMGLGPRIDLDPDGLNLEVGQRGSRLSGGERRRVALARALLSRTPIVVVDEPTTGLDGSSAAEVVAALDGAMGGRALLLVSHRDADAQAMELRYELRGGRMVPVS